MSKRLTKKQRKRVFEVIEEYLHCFARNDHDLGQVDIATHTIDAQYASSFKQREVVKDQVDAMLKNNVIEPASEP